MNDTVFKYIIDTLFESADEAVQKHKESKSEFDDGRSLAYWEVLDSIKNCLICSDIDPADFGLDVNIDKKYLD